MFIFFPTMISIKNSFCAFLARVKTYTVYSHQKLHMYIYWFSSESGYRRRRRRQRQRQRWTPQYDHYRRHIASISIILFGTCQREYGWKGKRSSGSVAPATRDRLMLSHTGSKSRPIGLSKGDKQPIWDMAVTGRIHGGGVRLDWTPHASSVTLLG